MATRRKQEPQDGAEYRAVPCTFAVQLASPLHAPSAVAEQFRAHVPEEEKREHFVALYLDSRNAPLRVHVVSIGTLNAALVHPREVFALALELRAASVIVAHNHPSGSPEPSPEDIAITERLRQAGVILGVTLLDHVVIGKDQSYVSFRERFAWRN